MAAASSRIVRVSSSGGQFRLQLPATTTLDTLQTHIAEHSSIGAAQQQLYLSPDGGTALNTEANRNRTLEDLDIFHGCMLYLKSTEKAALPTPRVAVPKTMTTNDLPELPRNLSAVSGMTANANEVDSSNPASWNEVIHLPTVASTGQASSPEPCASERSETSAVSNVATKPKFLSFDQFLKNRGYTTGDLPGKQSYAPTYLQQGRMTKVPPSVTLKHQVYRHVDHLELMNVQEVSNFVSYWRTSLEMCQQRCGWLFGYYLEDRHYEKGIRASLEGIYEPPQIPTAGGVQLLDDPSYENVEKIAKRLGLQCVGWIFTHLPREELLTAQEVQRIARLQLERISTEHYTEYPISTFVTCTVSPDAKFAGEPVPNAFMVSDLGMAFVRDGIVTDGTDSSHIQLRDGKDYELLPRVLESGKSTKSFDAQWFIVRVNESAPKKVRSIFRHTHFPRENREEPIKPSDIKAYFNQLSPSEPSWSQFADFHLLLYISQLFDLDMALTICDAIANKMPVDKGLEEVLRSLS